MLLSLMALRLATFGSSGPGLDQAAGFREMLLTPTHRSERRDAGSVEGAVRGLGSRDASGQRPNLSAT